MSINYQEIVEQIDDERMKSLLDSLNIPYEDKGDYLLMPTVCHHSLDEEASEKLYYYKNTHLFYCYTECGPQTPFTFLKNFYTAQGCAYDWFTDVYQVLLGCSYFSEKQNSPDAYRSIRTEYELKKNRRELPSYPEGILNIFTKYYPIEWLNDGISKEAMDRFNILYSPTQNKIIIPHYDARGRLVGIRGRALNPEEVELGMKYMPVQIEGKWYSHPLSLNLYGLNITKEAIKQTGIAYMFEAEKSVLQMESFDMPNCGIAVCGSKLNKYALDILIRECHPKEIVLCFDKEQTTRSYTYFEILYGICRKYMIYSNFSFIYDKENLLNLKDSPTDRGQETFKKLLEMRVKV